MIAMLDRDYTGKMGFNEFKELWAALNAWKQNFITIDQDQSGTVEHHELNQAIAAMGYRLSPQTLTTIVRRYSKNGRIFFDDYVACCVKLRALTDFFRRRDHLQQGVVNFIYDDFLQGTMAIWMSRIQKLKKYCELLYLEEMNWTTLNLKLWGFSVFLPIKSVPFLCVLTLVHSPKQ